MQELQGPHLRVGELAVLDLELVEDLGDGEEPALVQQQVHEVEGVLAEAGVVCQALHEVPLLLLLHHGVEQELLHVRGILEGTLQETDVLRGVFCPENGVPTVLGAAVAMSCPQIPLHPNVDGNLISFSLHELQHAQMQNISGVQISVNPGPLQMMSR